MNFNEKRKVLRSQGTHVDQSGNLYKRVNEKLYKYKEAHYFGRITYPCWSMVDNEDDLFLMERTGYDQ